MRNFIETDADGILLCPTCGENYLHHIRVADMKNVNYCVNSVSKVTLIGKKVSKSESHVKLPFRGDSIAISFWCENCPEDNNKKFLYISQHKGCTFLTWENEFPEHPDVIYL